MNGSNSPIFLALACLILASCTPGRGPGEGDGLSDPARYVGRQSCATCHAAEHEAWQGSHHDLAMQPADASTILGDFNGATFTYNGITSTFSESEGKFYVRTDGHDGELADFEISYTFGVDPLQQYLVEFSDGRLQALSISWDSRPADDGGQRWFHLYPDEAIDHEDELHWTGPQQNWNFMCAECHSTNLQKGYDADTDRFRTTWSEIDVSCETCHGPGSRHVRWAEAGGAMGGAAQGLVVHLKDTDDATWVVERETGMARRSVARRDRTEIEVCARCHSRRSVISEDYVHGGALMQTHRPAVLTEDLYHADGQILGEVYVYGSFLQSKMYREGVTCKDCHDPHDLQLHGSVDTVCSRCHLPARFDTPEHHFHPVDSSGARCIACHMPKTVYMGVDPRGDHSFRVPRPDLTVELGTPNACSACHADRSPAWAAEAVANHFDVGDEPHFARAFAAASNGAAEAPRLLMKVADDATQPAIVRASAFERLTGYIDGTAGPVLQRALEDEDPLVRMAALGAVESYEPAARPRFALPLLQDPVRAVRIEAARVLAPARSLSLAAQDRTRLDAVLDEYRDAQQVSADRAEPHLNLGLLHLDLGELEQAEREYRLAIERNANFLRAHVNLADLYRVQQRDDEGEQVLRDALRKHPGNAEAHHALGLLLVRQQRSSEAIDYLRQAATLRGLEPRYGYVYGVALHSLGRTDDALAALKRAHERSPADRDLLIALATISRDAGSLEAAIGYADKLIELAPEDSALRRLRGQLESRSPSGGS